MVQPSSRKSFPVSWDQFHRDARALAWRLGGRRTGLMPSIRVTSRDGSQQTLEAAAGQSLKDALKGAGVDEILGLCGGFASCGTCHVHVADEWLTRLPAMRADEYELLGFSDWRQAGSRLACQILFTEALDGIAVTVAPED